MNLQRIEYLRKELENETIDLTELAEIEEEFAKIPDEKLRDLRENALANDMLDEIEDNLQPVYRVYVAYDFHTKEEAEDFQHDMFEDGKSTKLEEVKV